MELEAFRPPDADPDEPPNAVRVKPLVEAQEVFAQLYAKSGNGTRAYLAAYPGGSYRDASTSAAKLIRKPNVKMRIEEIRESARRKMANTVGLTADKVARLFFEMAMADPNELIGLRIGCCRYCYGDNNLYQWKDHEYMAELAKWEALDAKVKAVVTMPDVAGGLGYDQTAEPNPECPNCMGEGAERIVPRDTTQLSDGARLLFQGVKQSRNGLEILMADKAKALENVGRILGVFKDGLKVDLHGAVATVTQAALTPEDAQKAYLAMLEVGGAGG
jgi:phage terminase small subunit